MKQRAAPRRIRWQNGPDDGESSPVSRSSPSYRTDEETHRLADSIDNLLRCFQTGASAVHDLKGALGSPASPLLHDRGISTYSHSLNFRPDPKDTTRDRDRRLSESKVQHPLRGGEEEFHFWTEIIEKHSVDIDAKLTSHEKMSLYDLQTCDNSASRVREIFRKFDKDRNGLISPDELMEVLAQQRLNLQHSSADRIVQRLTTMSPSSPSSGGAVLNSHGSYLIGVIEAEETLPFEEDEVGISVGSFALVFTMLRLAELFTPAAGAFRYDPMGRERRRCTAYICDYSHAVAAAPITMILGRGDTEDPKLVFEFFFGSRVAAGSDNDTVRWVHVDATQGLDRLTLLRLAVKYHLHPLVVEDIVDQRTPTKFDRYSGHAFMFLNIMTLSAAKQLEDIPGRVVVHRSCVAVFLTKHADTILTILQDRPDESSWMALWRGRNKEDGERRHDSSDKEWSLWKRMRSDLVQEPPRRMREHAADFLVYELLDRVAKLLRPISLAYAKRMGYMHQHEMIDFETAWLSELAEVQFELADLARSVRPLRQVIRRIINDPDWGDVSDRGRSTNSANTVKTYLEDVEDAIEQSLEDFVQLQDMARTLTQSHQEFREGRMNFTLYLLSVLSAIFLPAQFLTGLYGMNFQDENGHPSIPDLLNPHGYTEFWIKEVVSVILVIIGLVFLSKIGTTPTFYACCTALKGRCTSLLALCGAGYTPVEESDSD